mmetsp:Transcript_5451/g.6369  ORF Transcript_5451/g.6369 Transcript_5451/m.6369 type:complete len:577 (+) Transcript_5451:288-2018(+)
MTKSETAASRRTKSITRHLTAATHSKSSLSSEEDVKKTWRNATNFSSREQFIKFLKYLPNEIENLEYNVGVHLPGPLQDRVRYPNGWVDAYLDLEKASYAGENHVKTAEYQMTYGKQGLNSNIVVPFLLFGRGGPHNSGRRSPPLVTQQVIVGDPEDAKRIAKVHVTKSPNFTPFMYNSIISTTDDEEWHTMREHLVTAFLPKGSLQRIFPVTLDRAKFCPERLKNILAESKDGSVNISEFMLYETEAQLQLALFGNNREWMDETNQKFRMAMSGKMPVSYVKQYLGELIDNVNHVEASGPATAGVTSEGEVRGPLSDALRSLEFEGKADWGNALIFAFAGHDTTAHTLTWLVFELAQNMEIQKRLQNEVDAFFQSLNGRDMTYEDLSSLQFMTKCVMETLRKWPAVANGTYRQIRFDDYVKGPDGKDVLLPKGTHVQITNWNRHRSAELWGPDVNEFNPDREWRGDEIWNGDGFRAYNPSTERFSPFTFAPRDCIGKNFAQMEMRAILCYLLKDFTFELTDKAKAFDSSKFLGVNYGTMGPQDLTEDEWVKNVPGSVRPKRRPVGLSVLPVPRNK